MLGSPSSPGAGTRGGCPRSGSSLAPSPEPPVPSTAHTGAVTTPSSLSCLLELHQGNPRDPLSFPRDRHISPHPCIPQPQPLQAAKQNSCCSLLAEAASPFRTGKRLRGGDQHALMGPRMLHGVFPDFQAWDTHPSAPGHPSSAGTWGPLSLPALAFLQSHSLAKRSWQKPQDQLETAFIPGTRRMEAPHHLCSSQKSC